MSELLNGILKLMDNWRKLPAYQLERRLDIFFAHFLSDIIEEEFSAKIDSDNIIPEFPLKKNKGDKGDKWSSKVDYAVFDNANNTVYLFELKTTMNSIDIDQIVRLLKVRNDDEQIESGEIILEDLINNNQFKRSKYMNENKNTLEDALSEKECKLSPKKWSELVEDIKFLCENSDSRSSDSKKKYNELERCLKEQDIFNEADQRHVKVKIVYIIPDKNRERKKSSNAEILLRILGKKKYITIIDFNQVADIVAKRCRNKSCVSKKRETKSENIAQCFCELLSNIATDESK